MTRTWGESVAMCALAMLVGVGALARLHATAAERFDTRTAPFKLAFHGESSAYRDVAVAVLPNESVIFDVVGGDRDDFHATTAAGTLVQQSHRQWKWIAPEHPGTYALSFDGPERHDAITVHAFVEVPVSAVHNGLLNGYRIGQYPPPPNGNQQYTPPAGFIEVTKDNENTRVSPHFTLKQFVCKEDSGAPYPKYVVLRERLPMKLEAVLERVNDLGVKTETLHVMSAYRTPFYNHAIGDVKYSMHQFGAAADIYVDPENRDQMADLNHDGRIDVADAKFLYDEIEQLLVAPEFRRLQGGMGFYPATNAHPPFVHVDVRGTAARWKG